MWKVSCATLCHVRPRPQRRMPNFWWLIWSIRVSVGREIVVGVYWQWRIIHSLPLSRDTLARRGYWWTTWSNRRSWLPIHARILVVRSGIGWGDCTRFYVWNQWRTMRESLTPAGSRHVVNMSHFVICIISHNSTNRLKGTWRHIVRWWFSLWPRHRAIFLRYRVTENLRCFLPSNVVANILPPASFRVLSQKPWWQEITYKQSVGQRIMANAPSGPRRKLTSMGGPAGAWVAPILWKCPTSPSCKRFDNFRTSL